jgi:hypothetical protein
LITNRQGLLKGRQKTCCLLNSEQNLEGCDAIRLFYEKLKPITKF